MTSTPSIPPAGPQPDGAGRTTSWGAVPPPPMPPAHPPTMGKPSRRKAWLTHGATAFVALIFGAAIGGNGESDDTTASSARPAPAVTVTKTADAAAPEPAATVTQKVTVTPKPAKKPGPPTTIDGDGQYLVGDDIQAGTYKTSGPEDDAFGFGCYWARLKNASGELGAIIANDNITGQARVTVHKGEYFETKGCQKWGKVG
ncbi:hypothetical protein [Streptomyces sp. NPDC056227]|uniref:hypothetical protein n=1 Tax=Streptomyces sp. NPDC056227 TaxID=3345753 RepID=UPI0035E1DDE9